VTAANPVLQRMFPPIGGGYLPSSLDGGVCVARKEMRIVDNVQDQAAEILKVVCPQPI
jgi:hypothetical protein